MPANTNKTGSKSSIAVAPAMLSEAAEHGDMIFLNMTEGIYRCTFKYLEWLRRGPLLFPSARFFVLGDDDIFLSFSHLQADLLSVAEQTHAREYVLYGLLMWKAYYNNATMATHTGFASWDFFDWAAVAQRRTMHKCRAAMARRARLTSSQLQRAPPSVSSAAPFLAPGYDELLGHDLYPSARTERTSATLPASCYVIRKDHMRAVLTGAVSALPQEVRTPVSTGPEASCVPMRACS